MERFILLQCHPARSPGSGSVGGLAAWPVQHRKNVHGPGARTERVLSAPKEGKDGGRVEAWIESVYRRSIYAAYPRGSLQRHWFFVSLGDIPWNNKWQKDTGDWGSKGDGVPNRKGDDCVSWMGFLKGLKCSMRTLGVVSPPWRSLFEDIL